MEVRISPGQLLWEIGYPQDNYCGSQDIPRTIIVGVRISPGQLLWELGYPRHYMQMREDVRVLTKD